MKIYELKYIEGYNPETGAVDSCDILKTTDKNLVDKVINDYHLDIVNKIDRGDHNVFLLTEFDLAIDEYFDEEALELCIKEDKEYKEKPSWSWNFWNN